MKAAIDCDISDGYDLHRSFVQWLDAAEAGLMQADEMEASLARITEGMIEFHVRVRRALQV